MIRIAAVDDERLARTVLTDSLKEIFEQSEIQDFGKPNECMEYVKSLAEAGETLDYAFLDIQMPGMSGIELARQIKDFLPRTRILFCTAYNTYAMEAFQIQAKGYILKPVNAEIVREALDNMEVDWKLELENQTTKRLRVSTFGKFQVEIDETQLEFPRKKSKELLALLIDRKGEWVDNEEIMEILWEGDENERQKAAYLRIVKSDMMKVLKQAGVENLILKGRKSLAIRTELVDCDYYQYCKGDVAAVNSYRGRYMEDFSWAEFTTAYLSANKMTGNQYM